MNHTKAGARWLVALLIALQLSVPSLSSADTGYWKTYFSETERKAVQKNAEKYTRSEIKQKSDEWKGLITSFNIKNGSIKGEDIKTGSIGTEKVSGLEDALGDKLSSGGGTLSGALSWAAGQTFVADSLTGAYAALDGSKITDLTPENIANGSIDLGSGDLTSGSVTTSSIAAPDDNGLSLTDNAGNGLTVAEGGSVGIGTSTPNFLLDLSDAAIGVGMYFTQSPMGALGSYGLGFNRVPGASYHTGAVNWLYDGSVKWVLGMDQADNAHTYWALGETDLKGDSSYDTSGDVLAIGHGAHWWIGQGVGEPNTATRLKISSGLTTDTSTINGIKLGVRTDRAPNYIYHEYFSHDPGTGEVGDFFTNINGVTYTRYRLGIQNINPDAKLTIGTPGETGTDLGITSDSRIGIVNGNGSRQTLLLESAGTYGSVQAYDYGTSAFLPLVLQPTNGNVGIGTADPKTKLEVDGIIKTKARSSATCNTDSKGGIYFDSDDNHFFGCDGTTWKQLDN